VAGKNPDAMTQKMSKAGSGQRVLEAEQNRSPKQGDRFHCDACGMAVHVTADCTCHVNHAHVECCGQQMRQM
jgi:hypothetical protein